MSGEAGDDGLMSAPHVIVLLGGLLLVGAMGADIFATLVVPQASSRLRRLAPRLVEGGWRAWAAFRAQRATYAGVLAALARYCALPPDQT